VPFTLVHAVKYTTEDTKNTDDTPTVNTI